MKKLNRLISSWRKGTIRTSYSLRANGYSDDLISKYAKSKWIETVGFGAYKLYGDTVNWYGAVHALQCELESTIHVAGKSALQLSGKGHNINSSLNRIILFHNDKSVLPKWFRDYKSNPVLSIKQTDKFGDTSQFMSELTFDGISIKSSCAELAIMELLFMVPDHESLDEADNIMEGLFTLRPKFVQSLLEQCKSVKAKRLFMYLAEKHEHSWLKKINTERVEFGKGKRQVIVNGTFNKKYLITV